MNRMTEWEIVRRMTLGDFIFAKDYNENHDPDNGQFTSGSGGSPDYVDAPDEDAWVHANHKKGGEVWKHLQEIYDNGGSEAVTKEFYKFKTEKTGKDISLLDDREADDVLYNALGSAYHGWFTEANSEYKPRVINAVLTDSKTRSAALSIMYTNYKELVGGSEDYKTWLNKPVKLYRGTHGRDRRESDVFIAYTFSKKVAEKFRSKNGEIQEIQIKPIDTWGSVTTNMESEVMVPFYMREGKQ